MFRVNFRFDDSVLASGDSENGEKFAVGLDEMKMTKTPCHTAVPFARGPEQGPLSPLPKAGSGDCFRLWNAD